MDKQALLNDLDRSTNTFLDILATLDASIFTHQPSPAQWSPAQIAEHLALIDGAAIMAMTAPAIFTNRNPNEKLIIIKQAMESEQKFSAPAIVFPTNAVTDAEVITNQIQKQREKIKEIIATADLTEACTAVKHPALGTLTRLEWIHFIIYHMHRHTKQLKALQNT